MEKEKSGTITKDSSNVKGIVIYKIYVIRVIFLGVNP